MPFTMDLRWLVQEGYVTEFGDGRLFTPPPMAEQRAKARETWQLCRQLPGYDALRNAFEVQQADRGSPEGMPESLVVRVHSTDTTVIKVLDTLVTIQPGNYYTNARIIPAGLGGTAYVVAESGMRSKNAVTWA